MRGFILKLMTSMSYLLELPTGTTSCPSSCSPPNFLIDVTFVVILELHDEASPPESTAETKEVCFSRSGI